MSTSTVSARVAEVLSRHVSDIFGVMGNGNAFFLDAADKAGIKFTAVRHEGASVPAADAYYRVSGRLAVATTTYGAGFTNVVTGLAEAVQAQIPVVLVTGDAPTSGLRPFDVDQSGIAASVGAPTFRVTQNAAATTTEQAIAHALNHRTVVILAIPYDLAALPAADEAPAPEIRPNTPSEPAQSQLQAVTSLLASAARPLILAGRGAHLANAAEDLQHLADKVGALTASTALARRIFPSQEFDLGIAGGFGTEEAAELMAQADVVLVVGARLTPFTMRFGQLINETAHVIQIDSATEATHTRVDTFIQGDAKTAARRIADLLATRPTAATWRNDAAGHLTQTQVRHPGTAYAPDGLLDPRTVAAQLNNILPDDRVVVQDGGHFIGWAPMYWDVTAPPRLNMVGTAYQTIGLGLASAVGAAAADPTTTTVLVTGDGGLLMALADLESVVRSVRKGIIIVFNDCAYGAEIHQYAIQGVTREPMTIPDVDFAGIIKCLGGSGVTIRTMEDLDQLRDWLRSGEEGVFLADCRVSPTVCAPYMAEIVEAAAKQKKIAYSSI